MRIFLAFYHIHKHGITIYSLQTLDIGIDKYREIDELGEMN